jgi:GTPase SAR1 family protein
MGRFVQMVLGPAGVGKSNYCKTIQEHCKTLKRTVYVGNLDPASETFEYECAFDIKDLITVDEVMEQLEYGPNGGN